MASDPSLEPRVLPPVGPEVPFYARFDHTDVYRMMYLGLFGEQLPSSVGYVAAIRKSDERGCFGQPVETFR